MANEMERLAHLYCSGDMLYGTHRDPYGKYGECFNIKKHIKTKADSKKCKSCKMFEQCKKTHLKRPMDIACERYVKRKK